MDTFQKPSGPPALCLKATIGNYIIVIKQLLVI